jgi:hypothetical protein
MALDHKMVRLRAGHSALEGDELLVCLGAVGVKGLRRRAAWQEDGAVGLRQVELIASVC